jgi:hypothetical protein
MYISICFILLLTEGKKHFFQARRVECWHQLLWWSFCQQFATPQ